VGVAGTISLQYLSFATAPLVQANIVAYSWPLLVAAWLALSRLTRGSSWSLGCAVGGFGGVALMVAGGTSGGGGSPWGLAAAAGSALCMALYTLAAPRTAGREHGALVWATGLGAAAALVVTAVTGMPGQVGPALLAAAYTGVGPMAAGYLLWTRAMASDEGRSLAPLAYGTPLLSTALLVVAGRPLEGIGLIGAAITLAATAAVLRRPRG
jgi:drug/metabolite transporter (DMT)-like permease